MAHGLTIRENNFVEMAYTGAVPWHKLGNQVDHAMTAEEAIVEGGLDWEVVAVPVKYEIDGVTRVYEKRVVIARADNPSNPFQTCSTDYKIVQNRNAFGFFDGVVGSGEAHYHTVGSLHGGRRIWLMAKMDENFDLGDGDVLEPYLLLSNSHDGSTQVIMKRSMQRVVCANTEAVALNGSGREFKVRHTTNVLNRMNAAREELHLAQLYFENFMSDAELLAEKHFTEGNVRDMAAKVFEFNPYVLEGENFSKLKLAATDRVVELFEGEAIGAKLSTAKGTGWGAFNAFTQYIDYEMGVAGSRANNPDMLAVSDRRIENSWFGRGQSMRQNAWDSAMGVTI